jgi:hypothetical protein
MQNAQEVRFSDDATWMSHRNGVNFPKRAGNKNETGRFSFAYFSFARQRKVRPAAGRHNKFKRLFNSDINFSPAGEFLFFVFPKKRNQKKVHPMASFLLRASENCRRSDAASMPRSHSNKPPVCLTAVFFQCSAKP